MSFLFKIIRVDPTRVNFYRQGLAIQCRSESNTPAAKTQEQVMITELSEELEETADDREARIEKLRHKSRLSEPHRNMLFGKLPYPESKAPYHDSVRYKRRVWARYGGEESKVYPGIAWPDKEDLEAMKEFEQVLCPLSIPEMVAIEKNKIKEKEDKLAKRYSDAIAKFKNNEQYIAEFYKKEAKKAEEAEESKRSKEKLFNEIRQHFGFNLDPKDPKFQEMMEIRKKEMAKKKRQEKKKQREEQLITMAMELDKESRTKPADHGKVVEKSKATVSNSEKSE